MSDTPTVRTESNRKVVSPSVRNPKGRSGSGRSDPGTGREGGRDRGSGGKGNHPLTLITVTDWTEKHLPAEDPALTFAAISTLRYFGQPVTTGSVLKRLQVQGRDAKSREGR